MTMMMHTPGRVAHQDVLLDRTIDDLLLQPRGLVLVGEAARAARRLGRRGRRARPRGRSRASELARLIGGDGPQPAA